MDSLELAAAFPAATREEWQQLVAKVVKAEPGTPDPENKLASTTADGLAIRPLYTREDAVGELGYPGQAPFLRGRTAAGERAGWDVRVTQANPDPKVAHEQLLEDLEGGASSVWLQCGPGQVPVGSLAEVLEGVYLDLATVVLDAGPHQKEAAEALLALAESRGDGLLACLGLDPLGRQARTGQPQPLDDAVALATRTADLPGVRAVVVDALPVHEAGATDAQELAASLAMGVAYLRAFDLPVEKALQQLEFRYAATADQFGTVAKLRAARLLWARVAEASGVTGPAAGQRQHAVSSWSMLTVRDPWNNILRGTLAAFAAGVAGADAITVLPFDAAIGLPDTLSRRIARNTSALLMDESNVAWVTDPAGGSWYVENRTRDLAAAAWSLFQDLEKAGGFGASLDGFLPDAIAAKRAERVQRLAKRSDAITGVSEFPNLGETLLAREQAAGPESGGLPRLRWAEAYEELRARAEAHGSVPVVRVVPVGAPRAAGVRIDFVTAMLAPAGITTSAEASSPVVVICPDMEASAEDVAAAVKQARADGASWVIQAGKDSEQEVDDVAARGVDAFALISRTLDKLGVA